LIVEQALIEYISVIVYASNSLGLGLPALFTCLATKFI